MKAAGILGMVVYFVGLLVSTFVMLDLDAKISWYASFRAVALEKKASAISMAADCDCKTPFNTGVQPKTPAKASLAKPLDSHLHLLTRGCE